MSSTAPAAPRPGTADWLLEHEYVEYREEIIGSVRKRLFGRSIRLDADDLEWAYNSAWHAVHQKLAAGERIENRRGLLVVIMTRRILDERRTMTGSSTTLAIDAPGMEIADDTPDPGELAGDREQIRRLLEGLRERLGGRELQAATLCYLHGYTRRQAAQLLEIPRRRMEKLMDAVSQEVQQVVRDVQDDWCESNRSLVTAYALGVLAVGGRRERLARTHLAHCSSCRRRVLLLRGLAATVPPVPIAGMGGGLVAAGGAVGGLVSLSLPLGGGTGGMLAGAAVIVGSVVALGTGAPRPFAAERDATSPGPPLVADAGPRSAAVAPWHASALGADRRGNEARRSVIARVPDLVTPPPQEPGPAPVTPGEPGPTSTSPHALPPRDPSPEPRASRTTASSAAHDDSGSSAAATASGDTSSASSATSVDGDGNRHATATAAAEGPSTQATATSAVAGGDQELASSATGGGNGTGTVAVAAQSDAAASEQAPTEARSSASASGGDGYAELSTGSASWAAGAAPAAAETVASATGDAASARSESDVAQRDGDGEVRVSATSEAASHGSGPADTASPTAPAKGPFWLSVSSFDASRAQITIGISWLTSGESDESDDAGGDTGAFAEVSGSGFDTVSIAGAHGARASVATSVSPDGGTAQASATSADGSERSDAHVATDSGRVSAHAASVAVGDDRGGAATGSATVVADTGGDASARASSSAPPGGQAEDDPAREAPGARVAATATADLVRSDSSGAPEPVG